MKPVSSLIVAALSVVVTIGPLPLAAQSAAPTPRDEFFWLGEINKASTVINSDEGLLDKSMVPFVTHGLDQVLADGNKPGGKRPATVITFEPLLIQAAGPEITLIHAGRSSQDMHATFRSAILRDDLLALADQLNKTTAALVAAADKYKDVVVPNYTNGVAAQPNSLGHTLLGHVAALDRDAQRIREAYVRTDRSSMGTTVLNGTGWPLNRKRMADYLGFEALVDNAYDASQISSMDEPAEAAQIVQSIALHTGNFVQDVMTQYANARPWILLEEGGDNTYVSSAMPQKRNPGLLNSTRRDATTAFSLAMGVQLEMHNITPGMSDPKESRPNSAMVKSAIGILANWQKILGVLVVDRDRALDELNNDWTASQEMADALMRDAKLPFRVGHHVASEIVEYARAHDIKPLDFPYDQAQRIYAETVVGLDGVPKTLPLTEAQFRATLDPVAIVKNRRTSGGPQPVEMARMLKEANARVASEDAWIKAHREHIAASLAKLDRDYADLAAKAH